MHTQLHQKQRMENGVLNSDFYMKSHFKCTKIGKQIIEENKKVEEYYRTNRVGDTL
jgi:hypothetical protein